MDVWDYILKLLSENSLQFVLIATLLSIIFWLIKDPTIAEKWAKNIQCFCKWLLKQTKRLRRWFMRKYGSWKDQRPVNTVMKWLSRETNFKFPKAKFHYMKRCKPHGENKNGCTDVFIEHSKDMNKNLLDAAFIYLKLSLVSKLRPLVPGITKAIDFVVIMRMMKERRKRGVCGTFSKNYLAPELKKNSKVKGYLTEFLKMERKGFFAGITLSELLYADNCLHKHAVLANEQEAFKAEIVRVLDFFDRICNRKYGERTPLDFMGRYIRVSVLLVGKASTKLYEIKPYVLRVLSLLSKGVDNVFVVAVGEENVTTVRQIARHVEGGKVKVGHLETLYLKAFSNRPAIVSLLFRVPCLYW